jgi:hypothetical protein
VIEGDAPLASENRRVAIIRCGFSARGIRDRLGSCLAGREPGPSRYFADHLPRVVVELPQHDEGRLSRLSGRVAHVMLLSG